MISKKLTEFEMLFELAARRTLLAPLIVRSFKPSSRQRGEADAYIEVALPEEVVGHHFVIEAKSRSTPQAVEQAMHQATKYAKTGELPMIFVPYLSPNRLEELERAGISGIDMCGNGIVVVPGHVLVLRSGQPNRYRDSRPLNNPYRGHSALVARMLLARPNWKTVSELTAAIHDAGGKLSLPQTSKAIHALEEERVISRSGASISLRDPLLLLDNLGRAWSKPSIRSRQTLRLSEGFDVAQALSSNAALNWAVAGDSSVTRYATFSQGGPLRIAVSDMRLAMSLLDGRPERVPSFATHELLETTEAGYFFANDVSPDGMRWASLLQSWLELQAGDGRQQDAARDLRSQLLKKAQTENA